MWPEIQHLEATLPEVADNLALDEALLVEAEEGRGVAVLRFWEFDRYAVVLGASCRLLENVRVEACRAEGVPIARRSSGGGTVVIGPGALNFTVVLPIDAAAELKAVDAAQDYVLGRTAEAIRRAGPPVAVLGSGDLTLGGRKCSGSAQRRLRRHVMVHATILYDFATDRIDRYTVMPPRSPAYREGRAHRDFVTNLPLGRVPLAEAVRSAWLADDRPPRPASIPIDTVRSLVATKFGLDGWVGRL